MRKSYVAPQNRLDPRTSAFAFDQPAMPISAFDKATADLAEACGVGGHSPRFCSGHTIPRCCVLRWRGERFASSISSIAVWRRCGELILATPDRNVFYTIVATNEDVCDGFAGDKDQQPLGDRSLLAKASRHTEAFGRSACLVLIHRRSQPITNLFLGHPDLDGPESRVVFSKWPFTDSARRRPGDGNNDYQPETSVLAQP
jgi:hypothetical protein